MNVNKNGLQQGANYWLHSKTRPEQILPEKKTLKETAVWGGKSEQIKPTTNDQKRSEAYHIIRLLWWTQFYGMAHDRIGPTVFIDDVIADRRSGMTSQLFTALLCSDSVKCCKADHTDPHSANR